MIVFFLNFYHHCDNCIYSIKIYVFLNISSLADRTCHDLTQYPVFPWVLSDYISPEIDLNDAKYYRDLTKPIGALNEDRLKQLVERYEEMDEPK